MCSTMIFKCAINYNYQITIARVTTILATNLNTEVALERKKQSIL